MPRRPRARRPRLPRIPGVKAPDWWNVSEAAIKSYGLRELRGREEREPAGDPPPDWPGTRPEWAVWWALTVLGLEPDVDFQYRARLPELEARRYGEVDFLIWHAGVAIEIQGEFWHYGVGRDRQAADALRRALVESAGLRLVAIDEGDALADPIYYTREALEGRDHSQATKERR